MSDLFFAIAFVALIAFIIGLVRPKFVLMPNRIRSSLVYLIIFLISLPLGAELDTGDKKPEKQNQITVIEKKEEISKIDSFDSDIDPSNNDLLCSKQNEVYPTITAAIEYFNDYLVEDNTFKLISDSPLVIRLSPHAYDEDFNDVKELLAKRAIVYGIYRTFINSPNDKVTVISYLVYSNGEKLKNSPEYSLTLTKDQALAILKKYISINQLNELTNNDCSFNERFNQLRFGDNDVFENFFNELVGASK